VQYPTPGPATSYNTASPTPSPPGEGPNIVAYKGEDDSCHFFKYVGKELPTDFHGFSTDINVDNQIYDVYNATGSVEKCSELCAQLVLCRMFTWPSCALYSIDKIGCSDGDNPCRKYWVETVDHKCMLGSLGQAGTASYLDVAKRLVIANETTTYLKRDCCFNRYI
jgi:hypothetical protein